MTSKTTAGKTKEAPAERPTNMAWYKKEHLSQEIRNETCYAITNSLDKTLDIFYKKVSKTGMSEFLKGIDLEALKQKQKMHWWRIFLYDSDDESAARRLKMHRAHKAIGLEIRDYITAYLYIMNLFQKSILNYAAGPEEAFKMISAMQIIVADDIAEAIDAYYKTQVDYELPLVEPLQKRSNGTCPA